MTRSQRRFSRVSPFYFVFPVNSARRSLSSSARHDVRCSFFEDVVNRGERDSHLLFADTGNSAILYLYRRHFSFLSILRLDRLISRKDCFDTFSKGNGILFNFSRSFFRGDTLLLPRREIRGNFFARKLECLFCASLFFLFLLFPFFYVQRQ